MSYGGAADEGPSVCVESGVVGRRIVETPCACGEVSSVEEDVLGVMSLLSGEVSLCSGEVFLPSGEVASSWVPVAV